MGCGMDDSTQVSVLPLLGGWWCGEERLCGQLLPELGGQAGSVSGCALHTQQEGRRGVYGQAPELSPRFPDLA